MIKVLNPMQLVCRQRLSDSIHSSYPHSTPNPLQSQKPTLHFNVCCPQFLQHTSVASSVLHQHHRSCCMKTINTFCHFPLKEKFPGKFSGNNSDTYLGRQIKPARTKQYFIGYKRTKCRNVQQVLGKTRTECRIGVTNQCNFEENCRFPEKNGV